MKSAAITTLPVSAVEPSPTNPRKTFAPEKITQLADTIKGFKMIVNGELDHLPESAFYMVGNIDQVMEKAKKMA